MLIRTDSYKGLKRAKITLEYELNSACYHRIKGEEVLNLPAIANQLKAVERAYVNQTGSITMTLSAVTPVSHTNACEWLVINLDETDNYYRTTSNWVSFLAEVTAKFIQILSAEDVGRIARVEYDYGKSFTIMDNPD